METQKKKPPYDVLVAFVLFVLCCILSFIKGFGGASPFTLLP